MKNNYKCCLQEQAELQAIRFKGMLAWLFALGFACVDYFILRSAVNRIFVDSRFMVTATALSCAAILDLPMTLVGQAWKEYSVGEKSRKAALTVMAMGLSAFAVVFLLSFSLRMVMRDVLYANAGMRSGGLVNLADAAAKTEESNTVYILGAALFMGLLPLATSLGSLAIGYALADPKAEKICRLRIHQYRVLEEIAALDAAMTECGDTETELRQAQEKEDALYHDFLEHINTQAGKFKQKARLLLMEKLKQPDAITALTGKAQAVYRQTAGDEPEEKLTIYTLRHTA